MAINLATKFSDKIATKFTKDSYIKGKTSTKYDFTGVKGIKIYTPTTVPETDYVRNGVNRYGTPVEMQDTVQELVMSQDKSFSLTIDKGNNADQMNIKGAGEMLKLQMQEQSIPNADKYAFSRFVRDAGKVAGLSAKPTKTTIMEAIADAVMFFDDEKVPDDSRYIAVTGEMFKLIKLSPEFLNIDTLGQKAVEKGVVGEVQGMKVVKVPTSYLPTDCYFVAWIPAAVMFPYKIADAKYQQDPPGISGDLLEGRHYYDAFVLGAKSSGVYAGVLAATKQATPTVTYTGGSTDTIAIASSGASKILYTLDGSDPRYSDSAEVYGSAISTAAYTAGSYTVKAVAYADGKFTSDVVTQVVAVSAA